MRGIAGILGLLLVVAVVGLAARKQLSSAPAASQAGAVMPGAPVLSGAPQHQAQQFKQAAEAAVQQARPMPADDK